MTALAESLRRRYFGNEEHPYQLFDREIARLVRPQHTLLDAGCGRTAPLLQSYCGKAARLIGIDAVDFTASVPGVELYQTDLASTGLSEASVDLIMARSVIEHIVDPVAVYSEFRRILRPNGRFVFLTANLWDYASLIAKAVPNSVHPWIVSRTEGRREEDVFPIAYRSNTRRSILRAAQKSGLKLERFDYLGQYPNYFMFNGALFLAATVYHKLIASYRPLHCLQGWILCTLTKE